jgi:hypothetical protein
MLSALIHAIINSRELNYSYVFYIYLSEMYMSRDSSVNKSLRYGLDDRGIGFRFAAGAEICLQSVYIDYEDHLPSYPRDTGKSSCGVKRPVHEAENSPAHIVEVKNGRSYISTPLCGEYFSTRTNLLSH